VSLVKKEEDKESRGNVSQTNKTYYISINVELAVNISRAYKESIF
jgi:hypothetical protein